MNLDVRTQQSLVTGYVLTWSGDGFDEADFNVPNGEHPDEVSLDTFASADVPLLANCPVKKSQSQILEAPQPRNEKALQEPRSPSKRLVGSLPPSRAVVVHHGSLHTERSPKKEKLPQQSLITSNSEQSALKSEPTHGCKPDIQPRQLYKRAISQEDKIFIDTSPKSFETDEMVSKTGFFTARAAETIQTTSSLSSRASAFNPHLESPSIRKTAGVDHTKTKPVGREIVAAPPLSKPSLLNFVNPQTDKGRRVGMPIGATNASQNRNSYKPPQMKRPEDSNCTMYVCPIPEHKNTLHLLTAQSRPARPTLGDVTSTMINVPSEYGGGDTKRQKTTGMNGSVI